MLYYIMIEDPRPIPELGIGTVVHAMLVMFLVFTCTIMSLAASFYERRCSIAGDPIHPRIPWPTLFLMACGVVCYLSRKEFVTLFLTQQICVGVLSPLVVIVTSHKLRCYVRGIFQDFQDATLVMKETFAPYLSLRSPQVHPVQE